MASNNDLSTDQIVDFICELYDLRSFEERFQIEALFLSLYHFNSTEDFVALLDAFGDGTNNFMEAVFDMFDNYQILVQVKEDVAEAIVKAYLIKSFMEGLTHYREISFVNLSHN